MVLEQLLLYLYVQHHHYYFLSITNKFNVFPNNVGNGRYASTATGVKTGKIVSSNSSFNKLFLIVV